MDKFEDNTLSLKMNPPLIANAISSNCHMLPKSGVGQFFFYCKIIFSKSTLLTSLFHY